MRRILTHSYGRGRRVDGWKANAIFFLIGRAKRAPHWGVQSRFRVIYIYSVCRGPTCVGGITWAKHAHAQIQFGAVKNQ